MAAGRVPGDNWRMEIERAKLESLVAAWLAEDVGHGDVTSAAVIPEGTLGRARIEAREAAVIAGLPAARACFTLVSSGAVQWKGLVEDGAEVTPGAVLARIEGRLADILTAERTALNLLGHLSGIATLARRFSKEMEGTTTTVVDTRKTTPGLRLLEKYAVRVGGASNHRFGLDDGVLIKDNHVAAAGGVGEAVARARKGVPHGLKIEVEVSTLDQLDEAVAAGADVVLLDNMDPATVSEAVTRAGGKVVLEASGGVTLANARRYAEAGVDLISVGALTHSAPNVDVALEVEV